MRQEASLNSHKNAYLSILLMGIVSLMGDVVYEGSRGVVPSYLEVLVECFNRISCGFSSGS